MTNITENLRLIRERITNAEREYNRVPGSVALLAVTQKQPMSNLKIAMAEGIRNFGEVHLHEAIAKINRLNDPNLTWHYLGSIQAPKAQTVAQFFDWVHCVERAKIALALSEAREVDMPPINILLEVNINDDPYNTGVAVEELPMVSGFIMKLPRIKLRGLSMVPTTSHQEISEQREMFKKLREAFEKLKQQSHLELDTLCMGTSQNLEAAIAEGATMIRAGTSLFKQGLNKLVSTLN